MEDNILKLDAKDKKILYQLDVDARQPLSAIAKKVGLSWEVVNYRIKNLERSGIIGGYYAVIDIAKLGHMYCRVFMRFPGLSPLQEKAVMDYGKSAKGVKWITVSDGRWNITFVIYAKSLSEFEKSYDDLRFKLGKYFQEHHVSMAFKIYHFKHNYLFGTEDNSEVVVGDGLNVRIDKTDYAILNAVAEDARIPLVDISKSLGVTANSVNKRIKKLQKEGIILSFRAKINAALLGYEHYKVFLFFHNMTMQRQKEVLAYLKFHPNVIYITKAFGISDMEFEIMLKGRNELHTFMRAFAGKFSDIIKDYETVYDYSEPRITYLPWPES